MARVNEPARWLSRGGPARAATDRGRLAIRCLGTRALCHEAIHIPSVVVKRLVSREVEVEVEVEDGAGLVKVV